MLVRILAVLGINVLALTVFSLFLSAKTEQVPVYSSLSGVSSLRVFEDYRRPNFSIDPSSDLLPLQPKVTAIPSSYGYSLSRAEKLFPYKEFPKCWELVAEEPKGSMELDYESGYLKMNCRDYKGRYLIGPRKNYTMGSPISESWQPDIYTEPQMLEPQTEFVVGSCKHEGNFEMMQTFPRFKREVYENAMRIGGSLQLKRDKPLHILMLGLDSFSRNHFYRKLKNTVEYLRRMSLHSDWAVFDFLLHNIQGLDTSENLSFLLGEYFKGYPSDPPQDSLGEEGIWHSLRNKGFVSMIGFDSCSHNIYKVLGKKPNADHVVNSFYCALSELSKFPRFKKQTKQRCVEDKMAHWYMMNYTNHFSNIYKGANQWIYTHFDTAHEITGQQGQLLDDDLVEFLDNYLKTHSKDSNVVVYLVADHGMRYGDYQSDSEAIQEYRMPAFFMIAPKRLLNSIQGSYSALDHNSHRLTTKGDLRRSVFFLAKWQTGLDTPTPPQYYNLFTEKVPDTRTCRDAHIPEWFCSTNVMKNLPSNTYGNLLTQKEIEIQELLAEIASQVIVQANQETSIAEHLCQRLELKDVEFTIYKEITSVNILFKLIVTSKQSNKAKFDAWVMTSGVPIPDTANRKNQYYNCFPITYKERTIYGKIIYIERKDSYKGRCEKLSNFAGVNPKLCICYP